VVIFPPDSGGHVFEFVPEKGWGEIFVDNLLVQIHFIIVMIRWTGLAPSVFEFAMIRWTGLALWKFESPFPGSLTSTFLEKGYNEQMVVKG